jgi:hypothetical protein
MTKAPLTTTAGGRVLLVALALASVAGPALGSDSEDQDDRDYHGGSRLAAAALPSLAQTPTIAAAAGVLGSYPVVRALYATESGFQIYRCDRDSAGRPAWALRTPLAHLEPRGLTGLLVRPVAGRYHARSDFGALVSDAELGAMGLISATGVRSTAPMWQFTFTGVRPAPGQPAPAVRRETVAGRVLAQDTVRSTDIPWLLIEVRGRAVTTLANGLATAVSNVPDTRNHPIAASEYLLRFKTRGGVAPAASFCAEATLGTEGQQPYAADYYFVDINPPTL